MNNHVSNRQFRTPDSAVRLAGSRLSTWTRSCLRPGLMVGVLLWAGAVQAEEAQRLHWSADVGVRWEDNIGLGVESVEEFDDITTRVAGGLQYDLLVESGREFVINGTLFYEQVSDLDDLSNYGFTVGADYRGEFGQALTAPWYTFGIDYTVAEFADSDPRDGSWLDVELVLGKRFSQKFNLSGGVRYHQRWQDDDDPDCPEFPANNNSCSSGVIMWNGDEVFDQDRIGYFVNGEFNFNARTSAFIEFSIVDGDEDATGLTNSLRFCGGGVNSGCNVFTNDLAFGTPPGGGWFQVWKVDVTQRLWEVGVNHAFNNKWSLNVTAVNMQSARVENSEQSMPDYDNTAVIATLALAL